MSVSTPWAPLCLALTFAACGDPWKDDDGTLPVDDSGSGGAADSGSATDSGSADSGTADSGTADSGGTDSGGPHPDDDDGDGFYSIETGGDDCDDDDDQVHPDAVEVCNDVDDDCDGAVDEDVLQTWYADADGDGHGDPDAPAQACGALSGHVAHATDCDDTLASISPDATEICNGLDDDCDGAADDDDPDGVVGTATWYADGDGDGYGDPDAPTDACEAPEAHVADDSDCDDTDADLSPETEWELDYDGDGYGTTDVTLTACEAPASYVASGGVADCDDTDADVSVDGTEVCNGIDDDCDGDVDEDDAADVATWYHDADADGYGTEDSTAMACDAPTDHVDTAGDCDDTDPDIHPDAEDVCDGVDNDCDGSTDPGGLDSDGDGVCNGIDETVWSDDFDDTAWDDWDEVDLGGGNAPAWSMTGSYLYEASNAALSIATGPDLGELDTYTVSVEVYWSGSANNGAAIAFAYDDDENYWLARWLDPNDYYGSYDPAGQVDLVQCVGGACETLETDDGTSDWSVSTGTWTTLSVTVSEADIDVALDGATALSYTADTSPVGADTVGLWTYDNDGGVYYDDFAVTNP